MATVTLSRPRPPHRPASTLEAPVTPPLSFDDVNTPPASQTASYDQPHIPNKHLPVCPTGPARSDQLDTPPESPKRQWPCQASILYPPSDYQRVESGPLSVYEIDATTVASALDGASRSPLPDPTLTFPWFHGLHPQNHLQQAFFDARRRTNRKPPSCFRGLTVVKADGDLSNARLKGAVSPGELLKGGSSVDFIEADPPDGFSVRNFQIQTAKVALISDVVVYGDDADMVRSVAWDLALARYRWREKHLKEDEDFPEYNTFLCVSPFSDFENEHQEIVAIDSHGYNTGEILDFIQQERREMWDMTTASEISHNVFMGPTPELGSQEEREFDILIECNDGGRLNPEALQLIAEDASDTIIQPFHEFPSSGSILPPTYSHAEADGIMETCKWIYHLAHGTRPHSNSAMDSTNDTGASCDDEHSESSHASRKILIHCGDGYTESTMLGIAYFSFSTGSPVADAWLNLHTKMGRNFFAYPSDVALLKALAPRLMYESPVCEGKTLIEITEAVKNEPAWLPGLDGSFPSRVLDYLYLGNLGHANNPDLLRELGICQILSVGETAIWRDGDLETWGEDNVCVVEGVQDNGIDPLTDQFLRCLEFIDQGRRRGVATLVHCRVGVSRSATICIAEVMRAFGLSFPRAYCFVRARRLNVIIQPHLRFAYELLRWEEHLQQNGDAATPIKRDMEWADICREIALMNRPYAR